jgi:hypothetical protein
VTLYVASGLAVALYVVLFVVIGVVVGREEKRKFVYKRANDKEA